MRKFESCRGRPSNVGPDLGVTRQGAFDWGALTYSRCQRRPRDGQCVAANLSALSGASKSAVAKSSPGALAGVIQLHLDGELDLLGVCSD